MAKESILVIDDEPDIVELVQYNFAREGFEVLCAEDGEIGLEQATTHKPDLILLDLMLPRMDGLGVCRELKNRRETRNIPILMLTAKGEESDVVIGLGMGADDYVSKPFSPRELIARVRAVLRRAAPAQPGEQRDLLVVDEVSVDLVRHEVTVQNVPVELTLAEFRLLQTLLSQPGRVYTRADLVDRITAGESIILDRNVDVHVSSLRKKLGPCSNLITTIRGVGYKCVG